MIGKISSKIKSKLGLSVNPWDENSWTPYRIVTFLSSKRGQQKLLFFSSKIFYGVLRRATGIDFTPNNNYSAWLKAHYPKENALVKQAADITNWTNKPLFSIIIPTYNPDLAFLKDAISSIQAQSYPYWEVCISDDASTNQDVHTYLQELSKTNKFQVIFQKTNGHISENTNQALALAKGDYVVFMDQDDLLSPEALYQNALRLQSHPKTDILYSDEDKVDTKGQFSNPYFKPDWSPESLLSRNYICHLLVVKRSLIAKVGGLRTGFEGAQDYDLLLRLSEHTNRIEHISRILYHWRMHAGSTAMNDDSKSYYKSAGVEALNEALKRRNISATASEKPNLPGFYQLNFTFTALPKVSIVIPSKNLADVTDTCISSIFDRSTYTNLEVILINNNSDENSFFDLVKKWENREPKRFKCITDNGNFNFSRLMNVSVSHSTGDYVVLLNNDTETITSDWIERMLGFAQMPNIGAVGAKLLFPDDTIQHAGVVMGLNGIAGHFLNCEYKDSPIFWHTIQGTTNYSAVTAACFMVKKSAFTEVGGFNEDLAVEFNDVDFCLRLQKAGYRNVYCPEVILYHYESISRGHPHKTKESYERHVREIELFKSLWNSEISYDPFYNTHLSRIHSNARLRVKPELVI